MARLLIEHGHGAEINYPYAEAAKSLELAIGSLCSSERFGICAFGHNSNGSAMPQYDDLSQTPVTATQSINGIYPYDATMTQNQSSLLGQLHGGYNYDSNPNGGLNHNDHNHFASRSHAVFHLSIRPPPGGNMTVNGGNGGGILANISVGGSSWAQTRHISETGTIVTNNSTQITPRSVRMVSNDISYLSDQSGAVLGNRLPGYPYYVFAPNGTVSTVTASMGPSPHHNYKHGILNGSQYRPYNQGSFGKVQVPSQQQYYAFGDGNLRAHSNVNVNVGDGNDNNGDNNNNNNGNRTGYGGPLNGSNGNLNNINTMNLTGNNNTSMILHHGYDHSHGHSSHHGKKRVRDWSGASGYIGFRGMTGPAMSQASGVTGVSNVSGTTSVSLHHTRNTRSSGHPNNLHKKGHHNEQYYNQKNYYDKQYHQ